MGVANAGGEKYEERRRDVGVKVGKEKEGQ